MKVPVSWLREFVDPQLSAEQLADTLTMAGLEVEALTTCGADFSGVVAARVLEVTPHGAPGLNVVRVDAGAKGTATVVCGAPRIDAGATYALAVPGAKLPGGREIGIAEIRGKRSEGMLCSPRELGLGDDGDSLLRLDASHAPGTPVEEALALPDRVLELKLTPNRGDCLGLRGLAREITLLTGAPNRIGAARPVPAQCEGKRSIRLAAPDACPRYAGRFIGNLDATRPTPAWMAERLRRAGLRSVSALVDITNYVLLELGQPLHAFDNDRLRGGIEVRWAKPGERLVLLDGRDCTLDPDMLVIADRSGAVALAGIMGGDSTAVSEGTRNVFLESAWFNPDAIAGRARRLGLQTDASYRFERGVDFALQVEAVERATALMVELCGGEPGPVVDVRRPAHLPKRGAVVLRGERLGRLLGMEVDADAVTSILARLSPETRRRRRDWKVPVPSWRFDISLEEDLVEEVARIQGYDRIPRKPPVGSTAMRAPGAAGRLKGWRRELVARGYFEAITYSFVDAALQERLAPPGPAVRLLNPMASEQGVMRVSLFPGLAGAVRYNLARQQPRVRLFETGRVFLPGPELRQPLRLGVAAYGKVEPEQWGTKGTESDFYSVKGDLEALLGADSALEWRPGTHPALHPGQSADLFHGGRQVGSLGVLHPALARELELPASLVLGELDLESLPLPPVPRAVPPSRFPAVRRDVALLVDRDLPVARLLAGVRAACPDLLHNLQLFDVYQGEGIDSGKKSLALGLTFRKTSSTLVDAEVDAALGKILESVRKEFGATLRE